MARRKRKDTSEAIEVEHKGEGVLADEQRDPNLEPMISHTEPREAALEEQEEERIEELKEDASGDADRPTEAETTAARLLGLAAESRAIPSEEQERLDGGLAKSALKRVELPE